MSGSRATNPDDASIGVACEQKLELVIADYLRACEAGIPPDRRKILESHPELAADLRDFFGQHDHMRRLAEPILGFADTLAHPESPGNRIQYVGNYQLLEEIARGGMGVVYKARQTTLGRIVAVKMILTGRLASEQDVQRFQAEAKAAASLQHPNIVSIHEVGEHEGWHYFSMDYVVGRDLAAILREHLLSAKQAATYIRQLAEAIHFAHQRGTLHRDLKPSNVLIDDQEQVHITDFGLAMRVEGDSELTRSGQILGTPSYMPPEQAKGLRSLIGPGSDVYALGAVLYECLTGRPPFRAESVVETIQQVISAEPAAPRLLNPDVPRDLETICLKCLQKEPHRRYGTAQLLADDLGHFLAGEPITARPISRPARAWRWCRRNPVVATLSTAMTILLVSTASVTTVAYMREAKLYRELKDEQHQRSQLQLNVTDLEKRRNELNTSLKTGASQLAEAEQKLSETYLQLARAAWQAKNIELADYYLARCPPQLRTTDWHDLKRRCYPSFVKFPGYRRAVLSTDGKMLAALTDYGLVVKVWDVPSQRLLHTLQIPKAAMDDFAFSPDGKQLATVVNGQVLLWELEQGTIVRELASHVMPVKKIDFHPNGKHLVTGSYYAEKSGPGRGEVILWDLQTFRQKQTIPECRLFGISPDGQWLATYRIKETASNGFVRYEVVVFGFAAVASEISSPWLVIEVDSVACSPQFHPQRNELAIAVGNTIEFWDLERKQRTWKSTGDQQLQCLAYTFNGKRMACAGTSTESADQPAANRVVIWNLSMRAEERTLPSHSSQVKSLEFTPDGRGLVTADAEVVKIWDIPPLNGTPPADPSEAILNDIAALKVGKHDWPQWGGSRARINTPIGTNIPITWNVGKVDRKTWMWQKENSENIKWASRLGSQSYGNPVVANGKVFLGTNNQAGYLKRCPPAVDLGVLLCFEEQTGKFLWQHSNEKLAAGRVHDWPMQGVCSTPMVDGNRLWYVSNRGEVVCLDTEGFYDGEDDGTAQTGWVQLFRVDARLHGIMKERVPDALRAAFEKAGRSLPRSVSLMPQSSGERWTIGQPVTQPFYLVKLVDDKLHVSEWAADDPSVDWKELFTIEDHLLPHLDTGQVIFGLQKHLEQHGIQLIPETEPSTDEAGKAWSFVGMQNGSRRSFQVRDEGSHVSVYKQLMTSDKDEADEVWKFNMMTELGVRQHNMANCSVLTVDGSLFVCTSNGVDETHINIPAPDAPSFIALDRATGKVLWTDNSPGKNIIHAQWASPSYAVLADQPQVIFPGGDGWVYSFDPKGDGRGRSKLLWKFDGNPKTSKYSSEGRSTRIHFIAFPAIYDGLVYVVMGEDPERGEADGHLWCIDPTKRIDGGDVSAELAVDANGNVIPHHRIQAVDLSKGERAIPNPNSAVIWHYAKQDHNRDGKIVFQEVFHRSLSTPVIKDDILYVADFSGLVHCLNAKTGQVYWTYELLAQCWTSPLLVDEKVYICNEDGDVTIFRHSVDPYRATNALQPANATTEFAQFTPGSGGEKIGEVSMGNAVYMTPIVANNVLYIATKNMLYAIEEMPETPTSETEKQPVAP